MADKSSDVSGYQPVNIPALLSRSFFVRYLLRLYNETNVHTIFLCHDSISYQQSKQYYSDTFRKTTISNFQNVSLDDRPKQLTLDR